MKKQGEKTTYAVAFLANKYSVSERKGKELHGNMDGLSLHYYVHPEGWEIKGSATDFDDKVWYKSLNKGSVPGGGAGSDDLAGGSDHLLR